MMMQVVGVAHTFVEVWETVAGMLTELDVLLSFAELAVCAPTPYVRPTMLGPEAGAPMLSRLSLQQSFFEGRYCIWRRHTDKSHSCFQCNWRFQTWLLHSAHACLESSCDRLSSMLKG